MGFITDFIAKLGTSALLKILAPVLILILAMINTKKYGSALEAVMMGLGTAISIFFRTKLGNAIEQVLEWFIIGLLVRCLIYPILALIYGIRRDNKITLGESIMIIKEGFTNLLRKGPKKVIREDK